MKKVSKVLKTAVLANLLLLALYLFFNWFEYSLFNSSWLKQPYQISGAGSFFPLGFVINSYLPGGTGVYATTWINFPLAIFVLVILVNVYLFWKTQKREEKSLNY